MNDDRSEKPASHMTDRTSLSLLARARDNDPEGWRRLVELYSPLLYSWCRRGGFDGDQSADIVQEVLAKVARNLGAFRRDRPGDTFRGWLRVIARNQIRDFVRRQEKEPRGIGGSTAQQQWGQLTDEQLDASLSGNADAEPGELFRRALGLIQTHFEERTWRAFWQTTIDGRSSADVAADLGMSAGAVRQAKSKVLARLREEFGEVLESPM